MVRHDVVQEKMKQIAILTVFLAVSISHGVETNSVVTTNTPSLTDVLIARTNDMVLISFDTNETIRVEGRVTLPEEIDIISGVSTLSNSTPFMIEAAHNVRHYSIRRVMDSLSKQNFWKISFKARKKIAQPIGAP